MHRPSKAYSNRRDALPPRGKRSAKRSAVARLSTSPETRVVLKWNWLADSQFAKVWMAWIQQKIGLPGDESTRHTQYSRSAAGDPIISDSLHSGRDGVRLPIPGQSCQAQIDHIGGIDRNLEENILPQEVRRIQVNQHLQDRQRLRLSSVDHRSAGTIPSSAVDAGAVTTEGRPGILLLRDPPSGNGQENIPWSKRPIRSSTSLAPNSERAYSKGV